MVSRQNSKKKGSSPFETPTSFYLSPGKDIQKERDCMRPQKEGASTIGATTSFSTKTLSALNERRKSPRIPRESREHCRARKSKQSITV